MGEPVGIPSAAFFGVQRAFAERWASVTGCTREEALLETTTWYLQVCDIGRDFDADNPEWRMFLRGLRSAPDPDRFVHDVAVARARPPVDRGVFDYAYDADEATIRLSFQVVVADGPSPLAASALTARRAELRAILADARRRHPDALHIRGRSWLYNLPAYRRLFPPEFLAHLRPIEPELQFLSTWGQFVDRRGKLRDESAARFRERVATASSAAELEAAFPMPLLETTTPLATFAAFYADGVET